MPESRVSYFGPSGWSDSPDQAELKLESSASSSSNRLWAWQGDDWLLADETKMTGYQRGFEYQVSAQGAGLIGFQGIRIIDEVLLQGPLRGRAIYDPEGRIAPDPKRLGYRFALRVPEAKAFTEAVRSIGGKISKEDPAATVSSSQLGRLVEIGELDLQFVQKLVAGEQVNKAAFTERGRMFAEIITELRAEPDPDTERLNELQRGRDRAERIVERFLGQSEDSIAVQLLFSDLAATLGSHLRLTRIEDGVIIEFPGARLTLKADQAQWQQGSELLDALPAATD